RKEQIVHDFATSRVSRERGVMSKADDARMLAGSTVEQSDGNGNGGRNVQGASIGELFKSLSTDSGHLVQQEIALAKAELRESVAAAAGAGAKVGAAVVLALPGLMALTAAVVIGVGILIKSYWLSAAIVG